MYPASSDFQIHETSPSCRMLPGDPQNLEHLAATNERHLLRNAMTAESAKWGRQYRLTWVRCGISGARTEASPGISSPMWKRKAKEVSISMSNVLLHLGPRSA